jgi:hypothetical protein
VISAFVSLTLSPALSALILKPRDGEAEPRGGWRGLPGRFAKGFNAGFDWLSVRYGRTTARLVRMTAAVGLAYVLLIALAGWRFWATPTGFIPPQDQGYLIAVIQLPPGASLARTDATLREAIARGSRRACPPVALYSPARRPSVNPLIELQDNAVRVLEEAGQKLPAGLLAVAARVRGGRRHQDFHARGLELFVPRAEVVNPP